MTFPPPDFNFEKTACPKCDMPVDHSEVSIACPKCFALHHRRCVAEGVRCGNAECDYVFAWSEEDNTLIFEEYAGPERREGEDRRLVDAGAPDGIERRKGSRRRSDF